MSKKKQNQKTKHWDLLHKIALKIAKESGSLEEDMKGGSRLLHCTVKVLKTDLVCK